MAVCQFQGNSDMYGLGIRLGYYFQWFGAIFAAWLAPSEVNPLRFSIEVFVAASFLALIILTAQNVDTLQPIETYIVLLLMFGHYLALAPIFLWRLLTMCDPYWDPTRYPMVRPSRLASNLSFILLLGVLVYQYWFWFAHVMPSLKRLSCQQYGFLFGQVRLNSTVSMVVNAAHIDLLRNIDGWIKLIVASVVVLGVELTIGWNNIEEVNSLNSAGQTIPFVIGVVALVRIVYVYYFPKVDDYDSDSDSYYSYRRPGGGGRLPSPLPDRELPGTRMKRPYRPAPVHHRGAL
ncbi:hypothetical protein K491DRAFT_666939 [Lophiostoma macrostomum CBS 122681]|uniref:Uncharacterized protein n=1 Tax=Lophiostoma macrostomum CBS 122681 TaxID=1314788 RepID=A0A6A6SS68_9PLEO|nr:hypothetical protein K491DRAFT_666939 [Lophiostoma macrostomum CBS 122681]